MADPRTNRESLSPQYGETPSKDFIALINTDPHNIKFSDLIYKYLGISSDEQLPKATRFLMYNDGLPPPEAVHFAIKEASKYETANLLKPGYKLTSSIVQNSFNHTIYLLLSSQDMNAGQNERPHKVLMKKQNGKWEVVIKPMFSPNDLFINAETIDLVSPPLNQPTGIAHIPYSIKNYENGHDGDKTIEELHKIATSFRDSSLKNIIEALARTGNISPDRMFSIIAPTLNSKERKDMSVFFYDEHGSETTYEKLRIILKRNPQTNGYLVVIGAISSDKIFPYNTSVKVWVGEANDQLAPLKTITTEEIPSFTGKKSLEKREYNQEFKSFLYRFASRRHSRMHSEEELIEKFFEFLFIVYNPGESIFN